ncbi:MAG: hypothetical protein RSA90_01385 [Lachnospiraceae bacterium]
MVFYKELYVSEELEYKKEQVLNKLKKNIPQFNIYIITLSRNPRNHLEFYDAVLLQQQSFPKDKLFIVGIANGYDDALLLVETITQHIYNQTKSTNIRGYLIERQNQLEKLEL